MGDICDVTFCSGGITVRSLLACSDALTFYFCEIAISVLFSSIDIFPLVPIKCFAKD